MTPSEDHSNLPEINPQNIKSATYLLWASKIQNHWFKKAKHNTHTHTMKSDKQNTNQMRSLRKTWKSVKKNQTNSGAELIKK